MTKLGSWDKLLARHKQEQRKDHMMGDVFENRVELFKDRVDGNELETTITAGGDALIFDVTDNRTAEGAVVMLDVNQLLRLRDQIDSVLGLEKPAEPVGIAPDPNADRVAKDRLAKDMNTILDLFRNNPLSTQGDFILVNGNAVRVMEGLKNVLEGRSV